MKQGKYWLKCSKKKTIIICGHTINGELDINVNKMYLKYPEAPGNKILVTLLTLSRQLFDAY